MNKILRISRVIAVRICFKKHLPQRMMWQLQWHQLSQQMPTLLVSISLLQMPLARQQVSQIGQQHLLQTQRQLTPTQVKQYQVQMCNQLQLIRVLQLQIQLTILQQPLQIVQQQRIRQIQKLVHVVVVPWQKLVKPTPTQRLESNGLTANNTMSIVTVVCVRTLSLSKMVSLITLMLKQGLLRLSHRMNFQQNLSRQP